MSYQVRYQLPAQFAVNSLPAAEQEAIRAALQRVPSSPSRVPEGISLLNGAGQEELYVLPVGAGLLVLFTVEPGNVIAVQDILNRDLVANYG